MNKIILSIFVITALFITPITYACNQLKPYKTPFVSEDICSNSSISFEGLVVEGNIDVLRVNTDKISTWETYIDPYSWTTMKNHICTGNPADAECVNNHLNYNSNKTWQFLIHTDLDYWYDSGYINFTVESEPIGTPTPIYVPDVTVKNSITDLISSLVSSVKHVIPVGLAIVGAVPVTLFGISKLIALVRGFL